MTEIVLGPLIVFSGEKWAFSNVGFAGKGRWRQKIVTPLQAESKSKRVAREKVVSEMEVVAEESGLPLMARQNKKCISLSREQKINNSQAKEVFTEKGN
ncbi:hypothetical protein AMTR_s00005p00268710 [Amborella trichopoda]|uniref:Uncharacterized protein n=1 Tax=Amborella trichopoda TaxID=13333 RepID=W1PAP6_AMBTC|nr:hypothetical protein AMTR_s00005p00268710 [Amborella trichopoda]